MSAAEIFRSRDMRLCAVAVPADCALALVGEFMSQGAAQFLDAAGGAPAFARVYSNDFMAACTLESKVRQLRDLVARSSVPLPEPRPLQGRPTLPEAEAEVDRLLGELRALAETSARQRAGLERLRDYVRLLGEGGRLFAGLAEAGGAGGEGNAEGADGLPVRDPEAPDDPEGLGDLAGLTGFSGRSGQAGQAGRAGRSGSRSGRSGSRPGRSGSRSGDPAADASALAAPAAPSAPAGPAAIVCSVPAQRSELIQRQLFRSTRGNCVVSSYELPPCRPSEYDFDYPETSRLYARYEELAAAKHGSGFLGRRARREMEALAARLRGQETREILVIYIASASLRALCLKTLESGGATLFDVAPGAAQRERQLRAASADLMDAERACALSRERLEFLTSQCAETLDALTDYVTDTKAMYHTLNLFYREGESSILSGVFWAPADAMDYLHHCAGAVSGRYPGLPPVVLTELNVFSRAHRNGTTPDPAELAKSIEAFPFLANCQHEMLAAAPSSFRTDKFTRVYQAMVESYGSPTYKEINPAFFYLYQFPFTFSIMFGDIGHGIINAVVAALMCIFEKKLARVHNDLLELLFSGRYLILMMSVFSIITGLLYNDYFALAFDWFGSRYQWHTDAPEDAATRVFVGEMKPGFDSPAYPFGLDPHWHWGDNSMVFINSYKMKMAVIIGITQMIFGLILKLVNYVHMRKLLDLFTCWIPEFCFMCGFFGYMVFAIVYKWLHCWPEGSDPPALTNMLIQMFLSIGSLSDEGHLFNDADLQNRLQLALVFICLISVVWLALAKPVALIVGLKLRARRGGARGSKAGGKGDTKANPKEGLEENPKEGLKGDAEIEPPSRARRGVRDAQELHSSYEGARDSGENAADSAGDEAGHAGRAAGHAAGEGADRPGAAAGAPGSSAEAGAGVGDIVVQQVIHTIEFVLGCISHTASYLRLWALSLAHSQLAEVFFDELMGMALDLRLFQDEALNSVAMGVSLFIFYSAWFGASIVVLCLMEALSAYLHGLRLAWIEFNDKFFQAEGYQFEPLRFPDRHSLKEARAQALSE